jgi:YD repeat-containing protein
MNRKPNTRRVQQLTSRLQRASVTGAAAVVFLANPGSAVAGPFDAAMGKTRYVAKSGDVNNDGQNDVLMLAVPQTVMIPVDDDLSVPISLPVPSPTFALVSTGFGTYTLVTNPDAEMMGSSAWGAANQSIVYAGPNGPYAASVTITAATAQQASFVISMAADTGLLQITSTTAPTSGWAARMAGVERYAYDALGRLRTVSYPNGVRVTYAYDSAGNRTLSKTEKQ